MLDLLTLGDVAYCVELQMIFRILKAWFAFINFWAFFPGIFKCSVLSKYQATEVHKVLHALESFCQLFSTQSTRKNWVGNLVEVKLGQLVTMSSRKVWQDKTIEKNVHQSAFRRLWVHHKRCCFQVVFFYNFKNYPWNLSEYYFIERETTGRSTKIRLQSFQSLSYFIPSRGT